MKNRKGFTLIELIIVIAILAVIMLIGTAAYSSIQERMKVRSDKATAAQIGKAIKIRETDVGEENGIGLYPEIIEYDKIPGIENYVAKEIKPQSMEDGNFVATAFQTQTGKKIVVGIGKKAEGEEKYNINGVYNKKDESGWAWSEEVAIDEFLKDESVTGSIVAGSIPEIYNEIKVGDKVVFRWVSNGQSTTIGGIEYELPDAWDVAGGTVTSNNRGQLTLLLNVSIFGSVWSDSYNVKSLNELDSSTVAQLNEWYQNTIFATEASKYIDEARIYGFTEGDAWRTVYASVSLKPCIDIYYNAESYRGGVYFIDSEFGDEWIMLPA